MRIRSKTCHTRFFAVLNIRRATLFAPNQNFQTIGVTTVVSSHAMTAIPLPMER